ncbi:MAG: ISAs1 family transposase [Sphingomonadales bacterium]|nr:MAG: ISAs1 family transposase [Sphingomonadales bacterium]
MVDPVTPERFNAIVRSHWSVENGLHWVLDVVMDEDQARNRKDHGPQDFALLRKLALDLAKLKPSKGSMRGKLKQAGWDNTFLTQFPPVRKCSNAIALRAIADQIVTSFCPIVGLWRKRSDHRYRAWPAIFRIVQPRPFRSSLTQQQRDERREPARAAARQSPEHRIGTKRQAGTTVDGPPAATR